MLFLQDTHCSKNMLKIVLDVHIFLFALKKCDHSDIGHSYKGINEL